MAASSLTENEITKTAIIQREDGIQHLSGYFLWPEFSGSQRCFHQQFVYDTTMFGVARGLAWPDVISVAKMAKSLFPLLEGLELASLLHLLRTRMRESLPHLPSTHQAALAHYLFETCSIRRRLLQAVVAGAGNVSIHQTHLEVEGPPRPLPLKEGTDRTVWEWQHKLAHITVARQQKEAELHHFREGPEVTVLALDVPKEKHLDKKAVRELVRSAVRARGDLLLGRLLRESSLTNELLELRLQQTAMATRGPHHTDTTTGSSLPSSPHVTHLHTSKEELAHKPKQK
ncbi:uncharacterized protein C8orf74 homolog [Aplochiton taeniatus]